jgi:hypothetical protein
MYFVMDLGTLHHDSFCAFMYMGVYMHAYACMCEGRTHLYLRLHATVSTWTKHRHTKQITKCMHVMADEKWYTSAHTFQPGCCFAGLSARYGHMRIV